jgi:hypothetical protein
MNDKARRYQGEIGTLTKIAWLLIGFGIFAVVYGYLAFVGKTPPNNVDRNELALLGNFLQGAVASVWSLAAFIFIYVAFLGQQQQLEETREQLIKQDAVARQQRFENSFFELLRLHHNLVDEIRETDFKGETVHGRSCFSILYNRLGQSWQTYARSPGSDLEKIQRAYAEFYASHQAQVGHYFRNLYHIVRFVDESAPESNARYAKLVRAQLSSAEVLLLFYNGVSSLGYAKFKPLIEKYALLEQIPNKQLLDVNHYGGLYSLEAFQDQTNRFA